MLSRRLPRVGRFLVKYLLSVLWRILLLNFLPNFLMETSLDLLSLLDFSELMLFFAEINMPLACLFAELSIAIWALNIRKLLSLLNYRSPTLEKKILLLWRASTGCPHIFVIISRILPFVLSCRRYESIDFVFSKLKIFLLEWLHHLDIF